MYQWVDVLFLSLLVCWNARRLGTAKNKLMSTWGDSPMHRLFELYLGMKYALVAQRRGYDWPMTCTACLWTFTLIIISIRSADFQGRMPVFTTGSSPEHIFYVDLMKKQFLHAEVYTVLLDIYSVLHRIFTNTDIFILPQYTICCVICNHQLYWIIIRSVDRILCIIYIILTKLTL